MEHRDTALVFSLAGHTSNIFNLKGDTIGNYADLRIGLSPVENRIQEVVVHTGYYSLPLNRSSGSFSVISRDDLEQTPHTNILQRLEGWVPGVQYVGSEGSKPADIRIRGLATIESDETPLIVLDGVAYDGSMDLIDPNNVESVTVLKDASAASIWGAKAGNGVIVITTRQLRENRHPNVRFYTSMQLSEKPDLFYSPLWLPSNVVMGIEEEMYGKGLYSFDNALALPMYVDLLREYDDGKIAPEVFQQMKRAFENTDIRRQAADHLYRQAYTRDMGFSIAGGTPVYKYNLAAGHVSGLANTVRNEHGRITLNLKQSFRVLRAFDMGVGLNYARQQSNNNGVDWEDLKLLSYGISPYLMLVDEQGLPAPIPTNNLRYSYALGAADAGLLDWSYRPIADRELSQSKSVNEEKAVQFSLQSVAWKGIRLSSSYQFIARDATSSTHYYKDSFYARNIVNRFTNPQTRSQVIPYNGVFVTGSPNNYTSHAGRGQLQYDREIGSRHQITGIAGMELRGSETERFPSVVLYNYDDSYLTGTSSYNYLQNYGTMPNGVNSRIPGSNSIRQRLHYRELSYYSVWGYSYANRYVLNGSIRWDGTNFFGVKTNQKGVPLWSVGGAWTVSNESFYNLPVSYLRFRLTHGVAGNINKSVTHYPTIRYSVSPATDLVQASLNSVGNPSLRWEKVITDNMGLDFSIRGDLLHGTIDIYRKRGKDLIGSDYLDPTTGVKGDHKINYADIETSGLDLSISSTNIRYRTFSWDTRVNLSLVRNEVTNYNRDRSFSSNRYVLSPPPVIGRSRDILYAYPVSGLNPDTGLPLIRVDGEVSNLYRTYLFDEMDTMDDLAVMGVRVPPVYASLINSFRWGDLHASVQLAYKGSYVFRRSSMGPQDEFSYRFHRDYYQRWKQPGDEQYTTVPRSLPVTENDPESVSAATVYAYGMDLVTRGDHIRLQRIGFEYRLKLSGFSKRLLPDARQLKLSAGVNNIGVIWRMNRYQLDPDYPESLYTPPKNYSLTVSMDF